DFVVPTPSTGVDNTVTACGTDPLALKVCDTDHHHLTPLHPAIPVVKSGPTSADRRDGEAYSFKVTNTGDVDLTNVTVKDDVLGDIGTIASLAKGAATTLTHDFAVPGASTGVDNTATACGVDPLALKVCDTDHHHLTPLHPAIQVVKSGPATAHDGDKVTYAFKVTNTGDVDLTEETLKDDVHAAIDTVASLLKGDTTTLTHDFTVPTPS